MQNASKRRTRRYDLRTSQMDTKIWRSREPIFSTKNSLNDVMQMITLGKQGGMANEQRLSNWLMVKTKFNS